MRFAQLSSLVAWLKHTASTLNGQDQSLRALGSGPSLNQEQRSSWLPGTGQSIFAETFPGDHPLLKDLGAGFEAIV